MQNHFYGVFTVQPPKQPKQKNNFLPQRGCYQICVNLSNYIGSGVKYYTQKSQKIQYNFLVFYGFLKDTFSKLGSGD